MFFAPGHVFDGIEGIGSHFHILRSRARFRRYGGRQVSISCFALPDTFLTVPRASGPAFMFCIPGLVFGITEGVSSRFHVLRSRIRFRRYGGCGVPFSCFKRLNSVFDGTEAVQSRFPILFSRTRFQRYRECQVPLLCFACSDSFSV
jgi:hypothetical protein